MDILYKGLDITWNVLQLRLCNNNQLYTRIVSHVEFFKKQNPNKIPHPMVYFKKKLYINILFQWIGYQFAVEYIYLQF